MVERHSKKRNFTSLLNLSIDIIIKNLSKFDKNDLKLISQAPDHIKNRMLRKFTLSPYFWKKTDSKIVLEALVNHKTEHLDLTSWTLDDNTLNILHPCRNLQRLFLTRMGDHFITAPGLLNLIPQLKHIYLLTISQCDAVTDDVVECIANHCLNISGLDVGGCSEITDTSLSHLAPLERLLWLTFTKTQVSDNGIECLVKGPSGCKLKELRIPECPNISENILRTVALHCPDMETLVFHNCKKVQDQTCFSFDEGSFKNLKQLNWTIEW